MNKFFVVSDKKKHSLDGWILPLTWWSRPFEYAFAIDYLNKTDIVLDAGCGTNHPFKDYASKRVGKLYAVDCDEKIKEHKDTDKLIHKHLSFLNLDKEFSEKHFDKIFCLSVFEHMNYKDRLDTLKQFRKVLKDDGLIIMTCDYPVIKPSEFCKLVDEVGLYFDGKINYNIDEQKTNTTTEEIILMCFSAILKKR